MNNLVPKFVEPPKYQLYRNKIHEVIRKDRMKDLCRELAERFLAKPQCERHISSKTIPTSCHIWRKLRDISNQDFRFLIERKA